MKRILSFIFIVLVITSPVYGNTIYKWVDEAGVVNFTDDFELLPSQYRNRVEVIEKWTPQQEALQTLSPQPEAIKTDIYGLGEGYWRERVRPWKDQLKELEANYGRAHKEYMDKSDELSQRRFGSRTQIKMNIIELDKLRQERVKYESQLVEVKDMLDEIRREANEANANPNWLN